MSSNAELVRELSEDQSVRSCDRCTYTTVGSGKRCSRRTCKTGPRCWQHSRFDKDRGGDGVKIVDIPGKDLGAIANQEFKKGEEVAEYKGDILTKTQLDDKYGDETAAYAVGVNNGDFAIDAAKTNSGVARYINDCSTTGTKDCNAEFVEMSDEDGDGVNEVKVMARKRIRKNREITVRYGDDYWFPRNGDGEAETKEAVLMNPRPGLPLVPETNLADRIRAISSHSILEQIALGGGPAGQLAAARLARLTARDLLKSRLKPVDLQ